MERKYDHNSQIVYVDPHGVFHSAIVSAWWGVTDADGESSKGVYGSPPFVQSDSSGKPIEASKKEPGCNLVYMSDDTSKRDSYGRQIERATSVVHKSNQSAPANYWCWPDEV